MAEQRPAARRAAFDPAAYERDAAAFHAELEQQRHEQLSGARGEVVIGPIYAAHADLFSAEAVDAIRSGLADGGDEQERYRALLAFASAGHLAQAVADRTDAIRSAERSAVVMWRGEEIPYRALRGRVAAIPSRVERNALFAAGLEADEILNPARWERVQAQRAAVTALGFADQLDLLRVIHGVDPDVLAEELRAFLSASETEYFAAIRRYLARIEIEQGDASAADAWYLLRGSGWDHFFDARRLVALVHDTLLGLGIDLGSQAGTSLLVAPADGAPGSGTAAVKVPGDVRLVLRPSGGWQDVASALHEAAHLEHLAHVDAKLPFVLRAEGDVAVREGLAAVFGRLVGEPEWLVEHLRLPPDSADAFADFFALYWMWLERVTAARHLYQLRLLRGASEAIARAEWAGLLGLLTGVLESESRFLSDDDPLAPSDRWRGLVLAGALEERLIMNHGHRWWASAEAGAALAEMWRRGTSWGAERTLASLGYDARDWRPGLRRIRAQLIGEMSGYGGPNITTRAGTRKV